VLEELDICIANGEQFATPKKRSLEGRMPITDDEVRRSFRFNKNIKVSYIQLNTEPRRKNGQSKKTVSISIVEDLRKAIISVGI
jgi:hypothetical protein